VDQYQDKVRASVYPADRLHETLSVAIIAGQVGVSSTVAGVVPAAAVASIAHYGNDKMRRYLIDDGTAKAAAFLGQGVASMTVANAKKFEALLAANQFGEAAKFLEQSTGQLSAMKRALGDDPHALAMLDGAVQSVMAKGSMAAIKVSGQAYSKADDVEKKLIEHLGVVSGFTQQAAAKFQDLNASVQELSSELAVVNERVGGLEAAQETTALQVQAIQDVLFVQQPPRAKLALLESGAMRELTEDQRADLKRVLNTQIRQQEVQQNAQRIVSYASDMSTVLSNLGVQDPGLSQAVEYGNVATTALTQAFGGNYLGALASVSGLFASPKPDPMQMQFERVFAELSKIDKKLDEVIALQKETLRAIETLSVQLAEVERRISHRFDRIDFEIARLNAKVEHAIWNWVAGCQSAWQARDGDDDKYDESAGRFRSYKAMESYTNSYGDRAYDCQKALTKLYSGMRDQSFVGNPIAMILVKEEAGKISDVPDEVENEQYGRSALERYITDLHTPSFDYLRTSWALLQNQYPGWGNLANAYAMLATPSQSATELKLRMEFPSKSEKSEVRKACWAENSIIGTRMKVYLCTDGDRYTPADHRNNDPLALKLATQFLSTPVIRDQVGRLTRYANLVAGPSDIAVGGSAPGARSLNRIVTDNRASLGREIISGALMVSDVSIAQQAMIYGDLNAWFIFQRLWDPQAKRFRAAASSEAERPLFETAKKLLSNGNNPWLQRNVLMLILQSAEKPCASGSVVVECKNREMLYRLGYEKLLVMSGEGASATLATPTPEQITAAESWLQGLFDIHSDFKIETSDTVKGVPVPRRLIFNLDGYALPMPDPNAWKDKRLDYPPMMRERLDDRIVLAQRFADYTVFDGMDQAVKLNLVNIVTQGAPR
jgi:hypothetical protein